MKISQKAISEPPKISIIAPSLNQGNFIEKSILSVLSQNYPNLEYIVIDGGSSDNTINILNKYKNKINWISEKDNGQSHAINKGLDLATGDIISYLNVDDILLPSALYKVAQIFSQYPEATWLVGQCRFVDSSGAEIRKAITYYKNLLLRIRGLFLLLITNYISQPATFCRKEVISRFGHFDETLHYVMDYEYWLRIYGKTPPFFLKEYLAAFTIHHTSKTTSTGHKSKYIEEERKIIARHARSKIALMLHDTHRAFMSSIYALLNRA
jgi:glycosyltransferase involved in cell wall biosynthesis